MLTERKKEQGGKKKNSTEGAISTTANLISFRLTVCFSTVFVIICYQGRNQTPILSVNYLFRSVLRPSVP